MPTGSFQRVWGQLGDGRAPGTKRSALPARGDGGRGWGQGGGRAGRWPRGRAWKHPGLPRPGDFECVTSPVQAPSAEGGSEQ